MFFKASANVTDSSFLILHFIQGCFVIADHDWLAIITFLPCIASVVIYSKASYPALMERLAPKVINSHRNIESFEADPATMKGFPVLKNCPNTFMLLASLERP